MYHVLVLAFMTYSPYELTYKFLITLISLSLLFLIFLINTPLGGFCFPEQVLRAQSLKYRSHQWLGQQISHVVFTPDMSISDESSCNDFSDLVIIACLVFLLQCRG